MKENSPKTEVCSECNGFIPVHSDKKHCKKCKGKGYQVVDYIK